MLLALHPVRQARRHLDACTKGNVSDSAAQLWCASEHNVPSALSLSCQRKGAPDERFRKSGACATMQPTFTSLPRLLRRV